MILTVSMPNFNHAQYLPKRIPSLLAAMPENSELVIVDDGSTDRSVEIIEEFAQRDRRIVFIKHEKNQGVIDSLWDILRVAKGKYISFQSSDDLIFPHFFSTMLTLAEQYPDFAVYCSNFGYCGKVLPVNQNEIYSAPLMTNAEGVQVFPPDSITQILFKIAFWIPGNASILNREWVMKLGGFDHRLSQHSDWFLLHAAALMGGVVYLPETLAVWRSDPDNFTYRQTKKKRSLFNLHMNYFKILREPGNEILCRRFRNSTILRNTIRRRLLSLCLRPKYWDFLFYYAISFVVRRFRNVFGIKLKKS